MLGQDYSRGLKEVNAHSYLYKLWMGQPKTVTQVGV